jgi:hypothetical protein
MTEVNSNYKLSRACGDRIMLIDYEGDKLIRIYNLNSEWIDGYQLGWDDIASLKKFINL